MPKLTVEHWRTLEAVFLSVGFRFARQEGSHRHYVKPGIARPLVIPTYRDVPIFIIQNNIQTAKISRDEYFSLLAKVK